MGGLYPQHQEQWRPLRYLNCLAEAHVVKDGQIDLPFLQENVRRLKRHWTSDLVIVNIEGDLCRGRSPWSTAIQEWRETADDIRRIIEAIKQVDDNLKCSFLCYLPSYHFAGFHHGRCAEYRHGMSWIEWMKSLLAPYLDFYCLGRYPSHHVTEDARSDWDGSIAAEWLIQAQATQESLTAIRHLWSVKPLIPVTMPQWWDRQSEPYYHEQWSFVPEWWLRNELYQMRGLADSVHVWVHAHDRWPELTPLQAADRFFAGDVGFVLRRFAREWNARQKGE
jgi:hypothetical protein